MAHRVDIAVRIEELMLEFKNKIRQRDGNGLDSLQKCFQNFDRDGSSKLSIYDFEEALGSYG